MKIKEMLFKDETDTADGDVIAQLKLLKSELDRAYTEFQYQTDDDLLEACIYEIQALRSKYTYLLKIAKQKNLQSGEIVFGAYRKAE